MLYIHVCMPQMKPSSEIFGQVESLHSSLNTACHNGFLPVAVSNAIEVMLEKFEHKRRENNTVNTCKIDWDCKGIYSAKSLPLQAGIKCKNWKLHYAFEKIKRLIVERLTYNVPGDRSYHFIETARKFGNYLPVGNTSSHFGCALDYPKQASLAVMQLSARLSQAHGQSLLA